MMERIRETLGPIEPRSLWQKYSEIIMMVALLIVFNVVNKDMPTLDGYRKIILNNTSLILVVTGLSFVMISGGIDLSIGYQISIMSVVISILSVGHVPDWAVILGTLLVGVLCGLMNGILVGYLEIVPYAATIATQIIFRGISYTLSNGSMVSYIANAIRIITRKELLMIRIDVWLAAIGLFLLWFVLHSTFTGKYIRAIGLNEERAARAGVKVKRIKCLTYCIASVFYALAAMILVSRRGYAGSEIGVGMEITAIIAVYMGGALILAEKQSIITLLMGTLVVATVESSLPRVGVSSYLQYVITGLFLIICMVSRRKRKTEQL